VIPSDHFVRFYNEVFKALDRQGRRHLVAYWRELGRLQTRALGRRFRRGGLRACRDYWARILREENCRGTLTLTARCLELRMDRCPSLSKVLDNDAAPCRLYCDHCMGWVQPVMRAAGLYAVMDMQSRTAPRCILRIFTRRADAAECERRAQLVSRPYAAPSRRRRAASRPAARSSSRGDTSRLMRTAISRRSGRGKRERRRRS